MSTQSFLFFNKFAQKSKAVFTVVQWKSGGHECGLMKVDLPNCEERMDNNEPGSKVAHIHTAACASVQRTGE